MTKPFLQWLDKNDGPQRDDYNGQKVGNRLVAFSSDHALNASESKRPKLAPRPADKTER